MGGLAPKKPNPSKQIPKKKKNHKKKITKKKKSHFDEKSL
jgi:hypothetical protein